MWCKVTPSICSVCDNDHLLLVTTPVFLGLPFFFFFLLSTCIDLISSSPSEELVGTDNAQDHTQLDNQTFKWCLSKPLLGSHAIPNHIFYWTQFVSQGCCRKKGGKTNKQTNKHANRFPEAALPLAPVAYESRGALCHALIIVNHKPLIFTCFGGRDFGAKLLSHAAPALKFVGVGRAGGHADSFIVVIAAGHASGVVVRRCAAPQALGMATLILVCTGSLATWAGAHCKTEGKVAWVRAVKHREWYERKVLICINLCFHSLGSGAALQKNQFL